MTREEYLILFLKAEMAAKGKDMREAAYAFGEISDAIDALSHDERRTLRDELSQIGPWIPLMRNLSYDYHAQTWI